MKSPHTPSPWHIEKHNKVVWQDSGGPGNQTYATAYPITLIVHEQLGDPRLRTCVAQLDNCSESESNARLIASAPELLEACKLALKLMEYYGKKDLVAYSTIETAVRKAEGNA